MYASVEELVAHNSHLKRRLRFLALRIAVSVSSISNNWDSLFGGKASLKYSKTCSFDMSFYLESIGCMQTVLCHV